MVDGGGPLHLLFLLPKLRFFFHKMYSCGHFLMHLSPSLFGLFALPQIKSQPVNEPAVFVKWEL